MLRIALAVIASLALAAPAAAQTEDQGFESPPGPLALVPGGVLAAIPYGRTVQLERIDDRTGDEGLIAELKVGDGGPGLLDTDGDLIAYSVPGKLYTGSVDSGVKRVRSCPGESDPAPIGIDGDVLVAGACGNPDQTSPDL